MKEFHFDPRRHALLPEGVQPVQKPRIQSSRSQSEARTDFKVLLAEEMLKNAGIRLSKHALKRLSQHDLDLRPLVKELKEAFSLAERKGCRSTLVVSDDLAIVCSVPERTVVTVKRVENLQEGIFTNIDSTVVLKKNTGGSVLP